MCACNLCVSEYVLLCLCLFVVYVSCVCVLYPSSQQERPAIKELLLHPSGRTAFTDVVEFLSDFTLKNEEDKKLFCKSVPCMYLM